MSSSAPQSSSRLAVEQRVPRACDRGGPPPDTVRAQECRNNGLIPGVDAQEPVSDDEFESFGAMDVRTVKRLPASRCEPDHSETNMSSIWFLSIRQHEDSLHRLRRRSPSGRVAAAGRHLGDPARRLSRDHGQPFTGGGDPRERAVRQHPGRVEQPSVANGRAGLNRQGGDIGDLHPPGAPGPMSRQTT